MSTLLDTDKLFLSAHDATKVIPSWTEPAVRITGKVSQTLVPQKGQLSEIHSAVASSALPPPTEQASSYYKPEAVCDITYCEHVKLPLGRMSMHFKTSCKFRFKSPNREFLV